MTNRRVAEGAEINAEKNFKLGHYPKTGSTSEWFLTSDSKGLRRPSFGPRLSFLFSLCEPNLFALWFRWRHELPDGIKYYFELSVILAFEVTELTR